MLELESELGNNRGSGVAHIEPVDVLSGLGEGSEVPESTAKLDRDEEEEGGAGLDAMAPSGEVASARWWGDEAAASGAGTAATAGSGPRVPRSRIRRGKERDVGSWGISGCG